MSFDKTEFLLKNKEHREKEVFEYQLNIDNFVVALEIIDKLAPDEAAHVQDFKAQLEQLLADNRREQNKSKIMLAAIHAQLE